jgi:LysM repeat protein
MSKEFKAGAIVIVMLAAVFCGVLYKRVTKLKTAPAVVAKKDSKSSDKKASLFSSPNKLAATETAGRDETSASSGGYKWNTSDDNRTATKTPSAEAPSPRASFLPAEEPSTVGDRYATRALPAAESAPTAEQPAVEATPPSEAPVAAANPFPQPTTDTATVNSPPAENPPANSTVETDSVAIPADTAAPTASEPEASPPAKFDEDAPARIAAAPRTLNHDIYEEQNATDDNQTTAPVAEAAPARPASRFITPDDEAPQVTATPRAYNRDAEPATSSIRTSAQTPDRSNAISSGRYTVGPNENFWNISERIYGSGSYFKALHAYNRQKFPVGDELAVGDEIATPPASDLERQFPQLCPKAGRKPSTQRSYAQQASAKLQADGKTYIVQAGDTLFDIARYELGKAARWAELYELNRATIGDDIDFLHPGMELILPDEAGKRDSITRQPGSSLR